jgi:hypothetical protein
MRTSCALASHLLLCIGCLTSARAADSSESLALDPKDTCPAAKKREQELNAEVSQHPHTPIVNAKRAFRGDPAQLTYSCEMIGQLIRRQIFMRFADATAAEDAFKRQVSAVIHELGGPCVSITEGSANAKDVPGQPGTRRTIVWNISADYNAIAFFFPPESSQPWQVQLLFNSLPDTRLSKKSQDIWRVHGCTLPVAKERDRKEGGFTLFLP